MNETVLVINRVSTLRRFTVKAMRNLGYSTILEAGSVEEARGKMESLKGRIIVIHELTANKLSGEELTFLKSKENYPDLILIVTSQDANRNLVLALPALGVKNFILKSLDIKVFEDKLKLVL